jgi:hypothetical protein
MLLNDFSESFDLFAIHHTAKTTANSSHIQDVMYTTQDLRYYFISDPYTL